MYMLAAVVAVAMAVAIPMLSIETVVVIAVADTHAITTQVAAALTHIADPELILV